jgi:hypothetical protein
VLAAAHQQQDIEAIIGPSRKGRNKNNRQGQGGVGAAGVKGDWSEDQMYSLLLAISLLQSARDTVTIASLLGGRRTERQVRTGSINYNIDFLVYSHQVKHVYSYYILAILHNLQ